MLYKSFLYELQLVFDLFHFFLAEIELRQHRVVLEELAFEHADA